MTISLPLFKGPLTSPVNAEYVDYRLWRAGIKRHLHEGRTNGDERSYLRGLHNYSSLGTLSTFLQANIPNAIFRLQSVWVDKHPQAHFNRSKNCELGDLLLIARIRMVSGTSRRSHVVGWLLQAKTAADPARVQHTDKSTLNEVDLYKNYLSFSLRHFSQDLGDFDLTYDPDISAGVADRKWEFLQFCLDDTKYATSNWPSSPIQRIWPLGTPHTQNGSHSSFAEAVLKIAQSSSASPSVHGAVLERNPEWSRLCKKLLKFTAARTSRLARGPWRRVFPFHAFSSFGATEFDSSPSLLSLLISPHEEDGLVLTTPLTHSFSSDDALLEFVHTAEGPHFGQALYSSLYGRDREPPDDFLGADDGEEGGISTLIVDVIKRGD